MSELSDSKHDRVYVNEKGNKLEESHTWYYSTTNVFFNWKTENSIETDDLEDFITWNKW